MVAASEFATQFFAESVLSLTKEGKESLILKKKITNGINYSRVVPCTDSAVKNSSLTADTEKQHFKPHDVTPSKPNVEKCPLMVALFTYLSFGVIFLLGYVKEFFYPPSTKEKNREDYVPLFNGFESFYCRNVYRRIIDAFNNPICSVPGAEIVLLERYTPDYGWTMKFTGTKKKCINVGSYNYLGFAENNGKCHDDAARATKEFGVTTSSPRLEMGSSSVIKELESLVAKFVGTEAAITCAMGFATNVLCIPALVEPGCLVLSDVYNHASIILGMKVSGATVEVFEHNDCRDLEKKLRYHIIHGQPSTGRAWNKVIIVVEGIYSMEGTICNLPELIALKKKYKAYLYVDEAHSIGALGPNGGGVLDHYGYDPKDVDIRMGTFTKSFGATGGYIAGSKALIDYLRVNSDANNYGAAMSAPAAQQIITSMSIIMGLDGNDQGRERIEQLARNIHYFRQSLIQLGFIVYGHDSSPVVPVPGFSTPKLLACFRELTKRGVAGVVVGFPATKITGARLRFCLSASHTKENLDQILQAMDEVGDLTCLKYSTVKFEKKNIAWG